jgi:Legume-like lectin family
MRLTLAVAALAVTSCSLPAANAFSYLSSHSFAAPYADFNKDGMREVSAHWTKGGDTVVGEHFIRLTPDSESKSGFLWNLEPMAAQSFSLTLRFRISGSGEKGLHGDGLAVFFTADEQFSKGSLHGFKERFTGFGVVFDTFKNAPANGADASRYKHWDVAFISNDGGKELTTDNVGFLQPSIGCEASFRYFEGRADFNPARNFSQARLFFDGKAGTVSVWIDEKGTSDFKQCFQNAPVNIPNKNWWRPKIDQGHEASIKLVGGARLGITASTGGLADHHDVLAMAVGLEDKVAPAYLLNYGGHDPAALLSHSEDEEVEDAELVDALSTEGGNSTMTVDGRVLAEAVPRNTITKGHTTTTSTSGMRVAALSSGSEQVDAAIFDAIAREKARVDDRLLKDHHHLEATMMKINENLKAALKKVADQEVFLEKRVQELEKRVMGEITAGLDSAVDNSISGRLMAIEQKVGIFVDRKMSDVIPQVKQSLDGSINNAVGAAVGAAVGTAIQSQGRGWLLPFILLGLAILGVASLGYNRYRYLLKKHVL